MAAKKFNESSGFLLADSGYVDIAYQFVFDKIAPCDIVVYGTTESLKSGDIVLYFHVIEQGFILGDFDVQRVYQDVRIEVENEYNKQFAVAISLIIGKVLKVISFGESDWHEMIMEMLNEPHLNTILNSAVEFHSKSERYGKTKLDELVRRLKYLKNNALHRLIVTPSPPVIRTLSFNLIAPKNHHNQ